MATVVNMHDAKSSLSRLVKRAAAGEEILIAKNGKPLVRLTRLQIPDFGSLLGAFAGKIHMADDFDEVPDDFQPYL
jgi:antitoxin (DNA-binding transcriptional repressor) of toxin-antitoxin stability system